MGISGMGLNLSPGIPSPDISGGSGVDNKIKQLEQRIQQLNKEKDNAVKNKDENRIKEIQIQIEELQKQIQQLKQQKSNKPEEASPVKEAYPGDPSLGNYINELI